MPKALASAMNKFHTNTCKYMPKHTHMLHKGIASLNNNCTPKVITSANANPLAINKSTKHMQIHVKAYIHAT